MARETVYPEWVQQYRTRGTTVKKKGNVFYLYKRTSRRVPGKKYPQPVDTYIGIITPDGVIPSYKKKVSLSDIRVREFGFSRALWQLCPEEWKHILGDDWEDILTIIIHKWSPNTYLCDERTLKKEEDFPHCQFPAQMASLGRRISQKYEVDIKQLEDLKTIFLIHMDKETAVSAIDEDQKKLLEMLDIDLEVY